jgi:Xaa-Pro aminopeptidase
MTDTQLGAEATTLPADPTTPAEPATPAGPATPVGTADEQRVHDHAVKRARVRKILDETGEASVLLTSAAAVAWYLDGGRPNVSLAADPIVAVHVSQDAEEVLVTSNESARLVAEELPGGVVLRERPWYEPLPPAEGLGAVPESRLDDRLRAARAELLPGELARFRTLCSDAAHIVTNTLLAAEPSWTERRVAAELAGRLVAAGADPLVLMVSGESRSALPHPLPTDAPLGRRALVVACARRDGMIANLSRWVSFDALTEDEADAEQRILQVESDVFEATRPGAELRSVLEAFASAYATHGFAPDQWRRHHQGGAAGYAGRDPRAVPSTTDIVRLGQAFTWNPWSPGAKVEDTVLVTGTEQARLIEPLTVDERWPTALVNGVARPVTLQR